MLVASGTASLEAALCKRPMVVVYRLGALTAWLLRRLNLVKSKFFAQPNLLADRRVVGEYFQEEIVPESIGAELLMWLDDTRERGRRERLEQEFARIHHELRRGAGARAAQAILSLLSRQAGGRMRRIAGIDEAGRGPLAGPVVAAAVILSRGRRIEGVADSKALTPQERTAPEHASSAAKRCVSASAGRIPPRSMRSTSCRPLSSPCAARCWP